MVHCTTHFLRIRHLRPGEYGPVDAVFAGLSHHSRYLRFHGPVPRLHEPVREALVAVDGARHVALVAETGQRSRPEPVGIARLIETAPQRAEVAIAVIDVWQERGVGHRLLAELGDEARRLGYRELIAMVLPANRAAARLLHRAFPGTRTAVDDGVLELTCPLDPAAIELTLADLVGA